MTFEKNCSSLKSVFTEEQKDYIVAKYLNEKDASTVTIGKEFGVSYPIIRRVLNERNIKSKSLRSFRKKYELDIDFFEEINTEEKAYWLGFLYADGVINEKENLVRINLASIDANHLEKFRKSLKSTHPIKSTSKKTKDKTYNGNYIAIKCSKLCKDLVSKGCTSKKSFTIEFPNENILPKTLTLHFIRGYIDGDGSFTYSTRKTPHSNRRLYKINVLGTEDMLIQIANHFESSLIPKKASNKNIYEICFGGNQQVKKIVSFLYANATIYLDRKKQKVDECLTYIEDNPYVVWNKGSKLK